MCRQRAASVDMAEREFADDTAKRVTGAALPRAGSRTRRRRLTPCRRDVNAVAGRTGSGHGPVFVAEHRLPDVRL